MTKKNKETKPVANDIHVSFSFKAENSSVAALAALIDKEFGPVTNINVRVGRGSDYDY